jgi:RNA polymerase sigma factor (sigma-70 family)
MDRLHDLLRRYLADEPYRRLPDDDLWARFRDHREEGAFRVILERVGGRVYARCRAVLGEDSLADEAFQEAFVALFRHRAKLPTYRAAVAWLYETATNKARMHRRWWRRVWHHDLQKGAQTPEATAHAPEGDLARHEQQEAVAAVLAGLPERERRPVELVYLEGMTHAEAAEALGWPRGMVGTYVQRGLARLRRTLEHRGLAAVAGVAAVEAALQAGPSGLMPERLAALADELWAKATTGAGPVGGWWLARGRRMAAGLAVSAGLSAGGVALTSRQAPPPAPPAAAETPHVPPATAETVPERNLRVFRSEIQPRLTAALTKLALGDDGTAAITDVLAHGPHVAVTAEVRHGRQIGLTSRLWIVFDTHTRQKTFRIDLFGNGRVRAVNTEAPIVLWRGLPGVADLTLRLEGFTLAREAIDAFPPDPRAEDEAVRYAARVERAAQPYCGAWFERGDFTRVCRVEYRADRPSPMTFWSPDGGRVVCAPVDLLVTADGRLTGLYVGYGPVVLSADGGRLDFPGNGDWWVRAAESRPR